MCFICPRFNALGIKPERGDTLTIASQPFVDEFEGFMISWYETPWFRSMVEKTLNVHGGRF